MFQKTKSKFASVATLALLAALFLTILRKGFDRNEKENSARLHLSLAENTSLLTLTDVTPKS